MNDGIVAGVIGVLIATVGWLSYNLGRGKEQNASFEEKKKTVAEVRRLRASLDDPAVVERLHDRFKR